MSTEAPKRTNAIMALTLKVPYDEWYAVFHGDSHNRAASGALDESRTKAYKVEERFAVVRFYDADLQKFGAMVKEPERAANIARFVEKFELFIAAPAPA
jgi:hypothetical protein